MLRKLVLGLGAAGLFGGTAAVGQFASDRPAPGAPKTPAPFGGATPGGTPAAPAPFGGVTPAGPTLPGGVRPAGGYVPPVGGFTPASAQAPATAPGLTPGQPAAGPPPAPGAPLDIPTALGPNHPLALRPEHGP
ncbi:MAG TPA: hypothetical protein VH092_01005, partial [Urbifossiella sp.]|nr:hypothetical protein [Urbifossiella sp.]